MNASYPGIPLALPTLLIPYVCAGGLLFGCLFFCYIFLKTREKLHLSMTLLAMAALGLVLSEGLILFFGGIQGDAAAGRQFHRIEQLSALLFLCAFPYFIGHFLRFKGAAKRANRLVIIVGVSFASMTAVLAFAAPGLFVSLTVPHDNWLGFAGDYGRGKTGPLYGIRDILLALLFLYGTGTTIWELVRGKRAAYVAPMFAGLLFTIFMAVDDIQFVYSKAHIIPFPSFEYSRFSVGISVFIILSMIALIRRYIDEAMQREHDFETLKKTQNELFYLAYNDPLTGLPNRKSLLERLGEFIAVADRADNGTKLGFLVLDCGGFRDLSDRLGHEVGDWLMGSVAERLKTFKRKSDFLFRLDSDEFAILLTGIRDETDCAIVAEKFIADMRKPYVSGAHTLYVSPRAGIAVYPKDARDAPNLVRNAGSALVEAKTRGNDFQFYTEEIHRKALERMGLLHELRFALENQQFELHYQPQVDERGLVAGTEALIRWRHPELGLVPPSRFIPLAEETGLIIPLGRWVMGKACAEARRWADEGIDVPVSVNLSTQQLKDKNLIPLVENSIAANGLEPRNLHIEITESSLMENLDRNVSILKTIRDFGCDFSIDDFGTGYSSLSYLKKLPIRAIKIDRAFIVDLPHDAQDCALIRAIATMANGLDLNIVAEGVESAEQASFLRDAGCRIIQGYFYSKPIPYDDFVAFARGRTARK